MSTTDPIGDGGGGPGTTTSTDDNMTPVTPSTGIAISAGPQHHQHPPPSPLSGCYLLVVLPEPHTAQHRDLILNRLAKGFLSWDKDSCHVNLEQELQALVAQAPEGEEARNGERLIQYATENLVTEVLIHPQTNTLLQCIRNLLASFTKHRHIIHAGYTFSGNGSWILQDGTFSLADFLDAFSEHEVQRVLRAYENSVTVDINCAAVGEWSTTHFSKESCTRSCRVRLNPDDVLTAGAPAITSFTSYVGQYLVSQTLDQLMEPSDVVGNIRFSHPTLYVFPGGQGDAALFGINGFNMLVDGGFARKSCFWDFARHLDRLDAVLMTRINNSNVGGMSSVLRKKREMHVYPQIGHFFCNLIERRHLNSPDGDKDLDPLILDLTDIGHEMMIDLRHIHLRAHPCYRDPNPINLYHKVGHGTLDMYVLSPSKDSREVREFLTKWHASDPKLFTGSYRKDSNNLSFPIQNLASICALLVWQPANPEDTITRILFPGSTPQHKIFEGIDRLKHLDFLKHPVCTAKSLSPSTSLLALKDRPMIKQKLSLIDESKKSSETKKDKRDLPDSKLSRAAEEFGSKPIPQATPIIQTPKAQSGKIDVKTKKVLENKKIETESKKIEKDLKENKKDYIKKDTSKIEKDSEIRKWEGYRIKMDNEKTTLTKESKIKPEGKRKEVKESKPIKMSKIEPLSKPLPKTLDKKLKTSTDKKDSVKASPPTPKKSINSAPMKIDLTRTTPRPIPKPTSKQLLSTVPAKSTKDANNRKVVEQKNIEIASAASAAIPTVAKLPAKQKTAERKPIGRRIKPVSPIKARISNSPSKSTRSTPTTSVKSDKDGTIRKVKGDRGTTDSSTVSTPSGIELDSMTKLVDKCLTEKSEDMSLDSIESKVLADLKEEREVVEEIEAVLQKAERIEGVRRDDHLDGDDDITAEATDKKEDDMTEDDVTADIEELPKKACSRKTSHELTEEDEYLIIEKEEIYIEDSVQSGEGDEKHVHTTAESEIAKTRKDMRTMREDEEEEETEVSEEKEKTDIPEKQLGLADENFEETEFDEVPEERPGPAEILVEQMNNIIASVLDVVQKTGDKEDSGKKDSEEITKEPSSFSPDKFDSSEKKTSDTDIKRQVDQKDQHALDKLEESHERMSTLESGATTTAPTLPEDERIPLDDIKEVIDETCMADQDKKKDSAMRIKEPSVAQTSTEPKPDPKPFEVHPLLHGIQREIVKTPDEVADLPVHEEVDPTLYHMEDFEKVKEEKPSQMTMQETKEPEIPPIKGQKGVFSFFGKVADKFEKGIDKLTGKSRRNSEKDVDERSSSKSGSPKEIKCQNINFPDDVEVEETSIMFANVGPVPDVSEAFEKGKPEISKIKVAAVEDTASFLKDEIEDLKKTSHPTNEWSEIGDKLNASNGTPRIKSDTETGKILEPVFETCVPIDDKYSSERTKTGLQVGEDVEDVEALLQEASTKFKTVKDSLHDSLESLEEKIAEQDMMHIELVAAAKDIVKDTLCEVVEKLEDIRPHDDDVCSDQKRLETVKFDLPKADGYEKDNRKDLATRTKDLKGAVRDVGEVLAGSAGILIEDKPKDVTEIVKKVAEVLKEDDLLSHDVLFDNNTSTAGGKTVDDEDKSKKLATQAITMPKKVGITEELPAQEEIGEILESREELRISVMSYKTAGDLDIHEDLCVQANIAAGSSKTSPVRDQGIDRSEAMQVCDDVIKDELVSSGQNISELDHQTKRDLVEDGIESICFQQKLEHLVSDRGDTGNEIEEPDIMFHRKVSPATAEVVLVTPDLSPTSPKLPSDKMDIQVVPKKRQEDIFEGEAGKDDIHTTDSISQQKRVEIAKYISEEFLMKKDRMTSRILKEICMRNNVSRQIILEIIEEIVEEHKIHRTSVLDTSEEELAELLAVDKNKYVKESLAVQSNEEFRRTDSSEIGLVIPDRSDIENTIIEEFVLKKRRITPYIFEDICIRYKVPRYIILEIIEEISLKRNVAKNSILDITDAELSELLSAVETEDGEGDRNHQKSTAQKGLTQADTGEDKLVDGFVSIPFKHDTSTIDSPIMGSRKPASNESEKDVDDFEAVEEEYRIHGIPVTPDKELRSNEHSAESGGKVANDIEETIEDSVSDVVEALEKINVSLSMIESTTPKQYKSEDISGLSEIVHTTEIYFTEAQETAGINASKPEEPLHNLSDEVKLSETTPYGDACEITHDIRNFETSLKESTQSGALYGGLEETKHVQTKVAPVKTAGDMETVLPKMDAEIITEVKKLSIVELSHEKIDCEKEECENKSRRIEDKIDVSSMKHSTNNVTDQLKDSCKMEVLDEVGSKIELKSLGDETLLKEIRIIDQITLPNSTVRQMVVTASSESSEHETGVCPTGSIVVTSDDSLNSSPIETTSDQDSFRLDKESLRSGVSSPERDSISDKSTTRPKDDNKITPEDSLDKSPSGIRDSQDLEDSLDKSDLTQLKETDTPPTNEKSIEMIKLSKLSSDTDLAISVCTVSEDASSVDHVVKSTLESGIPKIVGDGPTKQDQLSEQPKLLNSLREDKKELVETTVMSIDIDKEIGDKWDTIIQGGVVDQTLDMQQSPTRSTESVCEANNAEEIIDETIANRSKSTSLSGNELVENTDIIKESSSIVSETQRSTEQQSAFNQPERSGTTGTKDTNESITRKKSLSSSDEYIINDVPDQPKPFNVFYDNTTRSHYNCKSLSLSSGAKEQDITDRVHQSRSPSIDPEKQDELGGKDSIDCCWSPTVPADKQDEEEPNKPPKSSTIAIGKNDAEETVDSSRSSSIVAEKQDEKQLIHHFSSHGNAPENQNEMKPIVRSRSCSIASGKDGEQESMELAGPLSIAAEKHDAKEPTDHSTASSVVTEEQNEIASSERSSSHSIAADKRNEEKPIEHSRSLSIGVEKHGIEKLMDSLRSCTISAEKQDETEFIHRSSSPSIVDGEQDETKPTDRSRSSSIDLEKWDEKESMESVRLASIAAEAQDAKEPTDRSRSSSIVAEEQHDKASIDRSRSTNITADRNDKTEPIEGSRLPSTAVEIENAKKSVAIFSSSSIVAEKQDEKESTDHSKSPSIAAEKQDEIKSIHRPISLSIDSEKRDAEEPTDCSRSSSIGAEKEDDMVSIVHSSSTRIAAQTDEKRPSNGSRSPSIGVEIQDAKETVDISRSSSIAAEKQDEKESIDHPKSPSIATEEQDEIQPIHRSTSFSIDSEKRDAEEPTDSSRSSSVDADKIDEMTSINHSRSDGMGAQKDEKGPSDGSRSPSIGVEKQHAKEPIDVSGLSSIAAEEQDEKKPGEMKTIERSRSSSIASGTHNEKESMELAGSLNIDVEKHGATEPTGRSRSSSISVEKENDKASIDHFRSASIASWKDEEGPSDGSRLPTIGLDIQDAKVPVDMARSSSIAAEEQDAKKQDEMKANDISRSSSVASGKHNENESMELAALLNIDAEKQAAEEPSDRSRSSSIGAEKEDEMASIDHSRPASIATQKDEKGPFDGTRSTGIAVEIQDVKKPVDISRSPSIAVEIQDAKEHVDISRSSRFAAEEQDEKKQDEIETIDRSRSSSIGSAKYNEKESMELAELLKIDAAKELIDRSRSSSVDAEKEDEKESIDHARSSSIATQNDEKGRSDDFRSPSVAVEIQDAKERVDISRSSSIAVEEQDEKKQDEMKTIDRSKSSRIASGKYNEKGSMDLGAPLNIDAERHAVEESIDHSRSFSVGAEKEDERASIDHSRSSSIASQKHEKGPSDGSRSPSIAVEIQDAKDPVDISRSSGIAAEEQDKKKQEELKMFDRSRSSSIASGKYNEKESMDLGAPQNIDAEKHAAKESTDRSRSPSVGAEKDDEKASVGHSRSSSIVSQKQEKGPSDGSRSPSIAVEIHDTKEPFDISGSSSVVATERDTEKQDEMKTIDRSRSSSIASGKHKEKESMELTASLNIDAEKHAAKESTDRSRSSSVGAEEDGEKTSIGHSRSSSIASQKQEKGPSDGSRSPSIAVEIHDTKEPFDISGSSSVVATERDTEKQDEMKTIDRSRSSSIASGKHNEKESMELTGSLNIDAEKHAAKESIDRSRSSSVGAEKDDEKASIGHSRSSSIASQKQEKGPSDGSRSPSISVELHDTKEPFDISRSSSVVATEQHTEKQDEMKTTDRSRSSSIASGKHKEKESMELTGSLNIDAEKHAEKESTDRSRSSSVGAEKDDEKTSIGHSRSSSIASQKQEKGPSDGSRSPSIAVEIHDAKEPFDIPRSSSIAATKQDKEKQGEMEMIDRSRSSSIGSAKYNEKESMELTGSLNINAEKRAAKESTDRSRSSSIGAEEKDEKASIDHSRSASIHTLKDAKGPPGGSDSSGIAVEIHDTKEPFDISRSSSIAAEEQDEKKQDEMKMVVRSRSSSITSRKPNEKESMELGGSLIIGAEKYAAEEPTDRSRSSSIGAEKEDEKVSIDHSRSFSIATHKDEEGRSDGSRSPSIAVDIQDAKERVDISRLSSIAAPEQDKEKQDDMKAIDRFRSSSIASGKHYEKESLELTGSLNIDVEKHAAKEPTDCSRSSSVNAEKEDEKTSIDHSRSASIATQNNEKSDGFRLSSIAVEIQDGKAPFDISRSSQISPEEHDEQKQDEMKSLDTSISSSIIEKRNENETLQFAESLSIAAQKDNAKESTDRSRSPSISAGKENGKALIDRTRSPSIASEMQDEMEPINSSRSSSITSRKNDEKELNVLAGSDSIVPENHDAKKVIDCSKSSGIVAETRDEQTSIDRPRSVSITADRTDEEEPLDTSRSSITTAGDQDEKASIARSRSPSIATVKQDEMKPTDTLTSSSSAPGKRDENESIQLAESPRLIVNVIELTDRARSSTVDCEKQDDKASINRTKSPSIVGETQHVKEPIDISRSTSTAVSKHDAREPIDRSSSSGIAVDNQDKKHPIDSSRSLNIAPETETEKNSIELSGSPNIVYEKQDAEQSIDCSKTPSTAAEEHDRKELIDRSRSPNVFAESHAKKQLTDCCISSSIDTEKPEKMEPFEHFRPSSFATQIQGEKKLIDESRASSIADRHIDIEVMDHSRSSSISSEKPNKAEPIYCAESQSITSEKLETNESINHCKSPSITSEDQIDKELIDDCRSSSPLDPSKRDEQDPIDNSSSYSITADNEDKNGSLNRSTSCSIVDKKIIEKEPIHYSSPASIVAATYVEKEPIDCSRSSSIVGDGHTENDVSPDEYRSSSMIGEKRDEHEPIDLSKSSAVVDCIINNEGKSKDAYVHSIVGNTFDLRKDLLSSVAAIPDSRLDKTDAVEALQKLAETIADKSVETEYDRKLHVGAIAEHDTSKDKSRSQSLFDADERTPMSRSRTSSLIEDKVPEVVLSLGEVKTLFQEPGTDYIYDESDQATILEENISRKSSMKVLPDDNMYSLTSDSKKPGTVKIEEKLSDQITVRMDENITRQSAEDHRVTTDKIARVEEYIVNRYITKNYKITPQIVDEISTLHTVSSNTILELIEAIILKNDVPRDYIVNFPDDDKTCISGVASKDDPVHLIDIPSAKRHEIETYIQEEFITKNKKISAKIINELAALNYISRNIVIMIIEGMALTDEFIENGIFYELRNQTMLPVVLDGKIPEPESTTSCSATILGDGEIEEHYHRAISANFTSHPDVVADIKLPVSDQERIGIETYVMDECVKKGRKITVLVLEQIMARMAVSRSDLLDIIENIIVTRKMSRKGMVDDAIYDEAEITMTKSLEHGFSDELEKAEPEFILPKDRLVEYSGKSTPDPKSSGYSTPEVQQFDVKCGKQMTSYSNDYESPFHKAFVGGMTEIRTTHITTLSGKSTPDYSLRGDTPESLSDKMTSINHAKFAENLLLDNVTSCHKPDYESTETVGQVSSILTTEVSEASTATMPAIALDSTSVPVTTVYSSDEDVTRVIFLDDHGEVEQPNIERSEIDKSDVITKTIKTKITEEMKPIVEIKVIKEEGIEENPEITTKIIRRSIIDEKVETTGDHELDKTLQYSQETSPETAKTITTIVTEDVSRYEDSKIQAAPESIISESCSVDVTRDFLTERPAGVSVETITTTVKTLIQSDGEVSSHKSVRETTDELEDAKIWQKISEVTNAKLIESRQTDRNVTETIKTTTLLPTTPENQTNFELNMSIPDCTLRDETSKSLGKDHSEKTILEKLEHPISPIIKDLTSDQRNYSGTTSHDVPMAKDLQHGGSTGKSTPDIPTSPFGREGAIGHPQISGRSTPDNRSTSRSNTATPEGFRSNEVIRTTITTTRTMSEEGDVITTTMEITETTNEKGETIILAEKTDVKVEDRILPADISRSTFCSEFESVKGRTDLSSETDAEPVSPRSDHSRAGTHVGESCEERHTYSDEDAPGSPLSTTSQVGYSPQSTYHFGEHSFGKGPSHKSMEFSEADMSSSFYGTLPDVPSRVITRDTTYLESSNIEAAGVSAPTDTDFSFKKCIVEKEITGIATNEKSVGTKYTDDADLDFEKALMESDAIKKRDRELTSEADTCPANGNSTDLSLVEENTGLPVKPKKDVLSDWDKPLGLPSPKPPRKFNLRTVARSNNSAEVSPDAINFYPIDEWGEPLRLPSPATVGDEVSNKGALSTPKKERKQQKKVIAENIKNKKRSESPSKNEKKSKDSKVKIQPIYMDLTYVPHHGNSYYTSVEFFKKVRARYYVFSGTEPSREVYDALLDAKKTWEDKDLEVTMIPTYDTDTLGYWVADNEEALAANHIDLSPSASRCTINLQDHETSCSAYRLEF